MQICVDYWNISCPRQARFQNNTQFLTILLHVEHDDMKYIEMLQKIFDRQLYNKTLGKRTLLLCLKTTNVVSNKKNTLKTQYGVLNQLDTLRDGPFNFQREGGRGGGYVFFPKKIFWFPILLKKKILILVEEKTNLIQSFCHIT